MLSLVKTSSLDHKDKGNSHIPGHTAKENFKKQQNTNHNKLIDEKTIPATREPEQLKRPRIERAFI